ncbi:MAG: twin-arginine translocation signal domain-containing protein [Planctomycetota bacterium]
MKLSLSENVSSKIDRRGFLKYCTVSGLLASAAWAVEEKGNSGPTLFFVWLTIRAGTRPAITATVI